MNDDTSLTVELTDDGSATLFVPALDEHYHSVKGALTESDHIYRDCAFLHRAAMNTTKPATPLRLLEVGFGTGLNACVTAMAATEACAVHYIALEKYPVDAGLLKSSTMDNYWTDICCRPSTILFGTNLRPSPHTSHWRNGKPTI